jgi:DNA repair protein RadC
MNEQLAFQLEDHYTSEIQISYKRTQSRIDMAKISCSEDAVNYFRSIWSDDLDYREEFYVMCLNNENRVLGHTRISIGGSTSTSVDVKLIFQAALKAHANCIIISHNHPSGNTMPSEADIALTKKIEKAAKFLDMKLLDHIIISSDSHLSFINEGRI